jgi:anti-sigma regulatory factor (Ser/Thr protein kinase)
MEVVAHHAHQSVRVVEASQPSFVRSTTRILADRAGFQETDSYRAGIVATELATNLVKHSSGGEVLVRAVASSVPEVELIAIDAGPGIADVAGALADGQSTAGSNGTGLGAIRRLSDDFDIYSAMGRGTVVWSRVRAGRVPARVEPLAVAGISVPKTGEDQCGDAWTIQRMPESAIVVVADGLGHGHYAAAAAGAAIESLHNGATYRGCAAALEAMHDALRHTRGAAAAILEIDWSHAVMKFAGVGNVTAALIAADGTRRQTVSHNGTLGHQATHFREYRYPWKPQGLLVMHSDGLVSHWSLDSYPGLWTRHPAIVAGVLYRDFNRGRDDVTVVVGREQA